MKKTFAFISTVVLAAVFAFTTVSCSDDDDKIGGKDDLMGKWYVVLEKGYYTNEDGSKNDFNDSFTLEDSPMYMTFNPTNDGIVEVKRGEPKTYNITWSLSKEVLTLVDKESSESVKINLTKLTKYTMVYVDKGTDDEGPYYVATTLKKILVE